MNPPVLPKAPVARRLRPASLRRLGGDPGARVRLVCFPWAGAGASVYRKLGPHLPPAVELLSVQHPGREDRYGEAPAVEMEPLVREVIEDLVRLARRPLVLFGHSMGAFVAYEVARALEARGAPAEALVVSGSGSPDSPETFVRCASASDDGAFLADLEALGGTPAGVLASPELLRVLLPVMRADYAVLDAYARRPRTPVSCPLLACASHDDQSVSPDTVRAWGAYTAGPYEEHWFEGDHFYLNARPEELAERLGRWSVAACSGPRAPICNDEASGASR